MALQAYGATIGYSAAGSVFTTLSQVRDITPPEITAAMTDVTHLTSANFMREKLPSWGDPGNAGLVMQFNHAGYAFMKTTREARTKYFFKVTLPPEVGEATGSTMTFEARVATLKVSGIAVGDEPVTIEVGFAAINGYTFVEGAA